jgi:hypothetical protein
MSSTSSLMTVGAGTAAGFLISKALAEWRIGKEAEHRSPPRRHFVSVAGVRLHYLDAGDGGTPVLLLHGNGTMAEDFRASGVFQLAPDLAIRTGRKIGSGCRLLRRS